MLYRCTRSSLSTGGALTFAHTSVAPSCCSFSADVRVSYRRGKKRDTKSFFFFTCGVNSGVASSAVLGARVSTGVKSIPYWSIYACGVVIGGSGCRGLAYVSATRADAGVPNVPGWAAGDALPCGAPAWYLSND